VLNVLDTAPILTFLYLFKLLLQEQLVVYNTVHDECVAPVFAPGLETTFSIDSLHDAIARRAPLSTVITAGIFLAAVLLVLMYIPFPDHANSCFGRLLMLDVVLLCVAQVFCFGWYTVAVARLAHRVSSRGLLSYTGAASSRCSANSLTAGPRISGSRTDSVFSVNMSRCLTVCVSGPGRGLNQDTVNTMTLSAEQSPSASRLDRTDADTEDGGRRTQPRPWEAALISGLRWMRRAAAVCCLAFLWRTVLVVITSQIFLWKLKDNWSPAAMCSYYVVGEVVPMLMMLWLYALPALQGYRRACQYR